MSTRVPNRYAEASSRGVNLLRALGCTTTLIVAWGPRAPGTHRQRKSQKTPLLGARVDKVATPDLRAVFFGDPPYLLGVDVPSKAGHNRPVCPQEHDDARVAC